MSATLKSLLALVVIAASAGLAYYLVRGAGPPFDAAPHEAIGKALAEQAAGLVSEGGRIVVLTRDVSLIPNPAAETQLKSLAHALSERKHPIGSTNVSKVDPLRPLRFPPGDYVEILRRLGEGDVVVSLLGPPDFPETMLGRVPEKKPRIVALCTGTMPRQVNLKKLFEDQLLHVAIVSRGEMGAGYPPAVASQRTFENLYAIVSTNNVSELAAYAK